MGKITVLYLLATAVRRTALPNSMLRGNPGLRVTGNLPTELGRAGFHHSFGTTRYRETSQVVSPGKGQATFLPFSIFSQTSVIQH